MKRALSWKLCLLALLVLALALWTSPARAFEDEEEEEEEDEAIAHDLTVNNYKDVMATSEVWMIDYYQAECHACNQIKPIVDQFAKDIHPFGVKVGIFDIGQTGQAKKLATAAGLQRLPHIKFFVGPPEKNPYTGKLHRPFIDFPFVEGQGLDLKMLKRFVIKNLPNHVKRVTTDEWPALVEETFGPSKNLSIVLTLTDRDTTPSLLKTMAIKYADDFLFVEATPSETAFLTAFDVKEEELAKLYVLPAGKGSKSFLLDNLDVTAAAAYTKDLREPRDLQAFLDTFVDTFRQARKAQAAKDARAEEDKEEGGKGKKKGGRAGMAGADIEPFVVLNSTDFKAKVYKRTEGWIVWFKPTSDAKSAEWDKYLGKAEGLLDMGVVDCLLEAPLCQAEGGDKFPFKAYPYGGDKELEAKGFIKVEDAYQEVSETVPDVLRRAGDGSNHMIIEQEINQAFGSGKYPVIVLTQKPEPALLFRGLALQLEPYLSFILVSNPSKAVLQRFNDAHVPSVNILMPQDMDLYKDPTRGPPANHALRIETYLPGIFGPMKFFSVVNFFLTVLQMKDIGMAQKVAQLLVKDKDALKEEPSSSGLSKKNGTITHITDAATWSDGCLKSGLLCVVGFFNGGEGEEALAEKRALLQQVSNLESSAPWSFSWIDGSCYLEFADAFDVNEPKLPTVVVYSAKKQRFAGYKGTLNVQGVREFLSSVLSGKIPTAPVIREPRVDTDVSRCGMAGESSGASDAAFEPVEEEEDIGDLMAEILAEEKQKKEELAAAVKREAEEKKKAEAEAAEGAPKKKIVRRKKKKSSDEL